VNFPYIDGNDLVLLLNSGKSIFSLDQSIEYTDSGEVQLLLNQYVNGKVQAITIVTSDNNTITIVYMKIK